MMQPALSVFTDAFDLALSKSMEEKLWREMTAHGHEPPAHGHEPRTLGRAPCSGSKPPTDGHEPPTAGAYGIRASPPASSGGGGAHDRAPVPLFVSDEEDDFDADAAADCEAVWDMRVAPTPPTAVRQMSPRSGRHFVICPDTPGTPARIYLDAPHPWQRFIDPGTGDHWLWNEDTGMWFWVVF